MSGDEGQVLIADLPATDRRAIKAIVGPHDSLWPAGDIITLPTINHPAMVESFEASPAAYGTMVRRLLRQARGVLAVIDWCGGRTRGVTLVVESVSHPGNYLGTEWGGGLGLQIEGATVYEDSGEDEPSPAGWWTRPKDTIRSFLTDADWDDPDSSVCRVKRLAAGQGTHG